jgi:hypothetical protein
MFGFRKIIWVLLLLFYPLLLLSQRFNYEWRNIGPDNFGGRTRALAITKSGKLYAGSIGGGLWESKDGGFRWEPVAGFNKISNNDPNSNRCLSVSSIAIDPNNDNIIYIGTGELVFNYNTDAPSLPMPPLSELNAYQEGYLGYVGLPGQGVFYSEDGGKTFTNNNATWPASITYPLTSFDTQNPFLSIQKVAVAPNGRVFIGTHKGVFYSDDKLRTVVRSIDNYNANIPTLRNASDSLRNATVMDIEIGNNGRVYVATHNNVFVSEDNGSTFTKVIGDAILPRNTSDILSNVPKSRMEVAVAPSNKDIVYIAEVNLNGFLAGVWKSENAGNTWRQIAPRSSAPGTVPPNLSFAPLAKGGRGRGKYSILLAVDGKDPHRIWLGGQQLLEYSMQYGWISFTSSRALPRLGNYVPANLHCAVNHPTNPNIIYFSSDNEIIRTTDGGKSFVLASGNYNVTPVLSITANLKDEILVSTQNAGLLQRFKQHTFDQKYRSLLPSQRGLVRSSLFNPSYLLASSPNAILQRSFNDGENFERFYGFPENNPKYEFRNQNILKPNTQAPDPTDNPYPITVFALDEVLNVKARGNKVALNNAILNPQYLYFCTSQRIWLVKNPFNPFGSDTLAPPTWTAITKDKIDPNSYFSAIAVSGDTTHTVFAGTTQGKLFRITNAHDPDTSRGSKFKVEDITPPNTPRQWITSITVNPWNRENIVLTYGGYDIFDENDFSKNYRIYVSFNAKTASAPTFSPIHGTMPFMPIYSALFHPNPRPMNPQDSTLLLVGTEYGVYSISIQELDKPNDEIEWFSANSGAMERVPVFDMFYKQWDYKYRCDRFENNDPRKRCLENVNYLEPAKNSKIYLATYGRGVFESSLMGGNRTVSLEQPLVNEDDAIFSLYPNPTSKLATLEFILDTPSDLVIEAYNLEGKVISNWRYRQLNAGLQRQSLDFSHFTPGVYIVKYTFTKAGKPIIRSSKLVVQ